MIELERRALLGDRKAQEECTEKGIILPCPLCGGKAERGMNKRDSRKRYGVYHTIATVQCTACTAKVTMAGFDVETAYRYAEGHWNTRPAPPVGRCGECVAYVDYKCANTGYYKPDTGFCNDFAPKEAEEK